MSKKIRVFLLGASLLGASLVLRADEGMWTFDNVPAARIQAKYGFAPDPGWLEHLRLSVLRFPGGTGAFVSRDGLVLTNHHVAHSWIEAVSGPDHDYVRDGFLAPDRAGEIPVPGLALRTLMATENVTAALDRAVPADVPEGQADRARREALAGLVRAAEQRTGLASEPVTLYHGGETWIYSYKVYGDVRLVMAPEFAVAAFGRNWDNFTYPRHDLDFCLFRVYQDGVPLRCAHYLRWCGGGLRAGDLTFVAGHPARTSRLETLAQMEADRDVAGPLKLRSLDRARQALRAFAARGPEAARLVTARRLAVANAYKIYQYENEGLKDAEAMARLARAEQELRARVAADPRLQASTGASWDLVRRAVQARDAVARETAMLDGRGSRALAFAEGLVRWKTEAAKPKAQRDLGYRTGRDEEILRSSLAIPEPLDRAVEEAALAQGLQEALEELGADHPITQALLAGEAPSRRAKALMAGTRLLDPAGRRALCRAQPQAVRDSDDPLVVLARRLDQVSRPYVRRREEADAVIAEQGARIARARFLVYGKDEYPDATFSLRLSYGTVEPCPGGGTLVQPFTTIGGLYDRADGWGPEAEHGSWALPRRWLERRAALDPSTPLNFISSNDIAGGNSGSPVVDRQGRWAGLVFDGNLASVAGRYYYDPKVNRAVALDGRAILEALDKVYGAQGLVREITGE
jgi:hypothetical protein